MLLVDMRDKYRPDFHVFGDFEIERHVPTRREPFRDSMVLNDKLRLTYTSFSKMPRYDGTSFDSIDVDGHKLVGYVRLPSRALSDEHAVVGGFDLIGHIVFFQNNVVSDYDPNAVFLKWIRCVPDVARQSEHHRILPSIVRTYDGDWLLMYMDKREIIAEKLESTGFIRNAVFTPLETVLSNEASYMEKQMQKMAQRHEKLRTNPYDLAALLNRSNHDLLESIPSRPS